MPTRSAGTPSQALQPTGGVSAGRHAGGGDRIAPRRRDHRRRLRGQGSRTATPLTCTASASRTGSAPTDLSQTPRPRVVRCSRCDSRIAPEQCCACAIAECPGSTASSPKRMRFFYEKEFFSHISRSPGSPKLVSRWQVYFSSRSSGCILVRLCHQYRPFYKKNPTRKMH